MEHECIFCLIARRDAPARVLDEDESTLAFLDINPAALGHALVIPKVHATDVFDVNDDDAAAVAVMVNRVAALLDERLRPDGLTVFQANRPAGWQTVFHLHVHLVPRWTDDDLVPPWEPTPADPGSLAEVYERLR